MHDVFFTAKRLFHKSNWLGRALLGGYELTPSRFDVLYLLHVTPRPFLWQSALRKHVGVTAATSSVMLRALVAIGLVERTKSEDDKRQLEVRLTKLGRELIARAVAALRTKKIVDYIAKRVVTSRWHKKEDAEMDMHEHLESMHAMRKRLKDKAMLVYSSHPDD